MHRTGSRLIFALLAVLLAGPAQAVTIVFQAIDLADVTPGKNLYRYSYSVVDFSYSTQFGVSVVFDPTLYASLASPPPPVGPEWDVVALQPDPELPADGSYDARRVAGSTATATFTIDFVWLGAGVPGSQPFVVYDPAFATVASGQTVPEPDVGVMLWIGAGAIAVLRRRGRSPRPHVDARPDRVDPRSAARANAAPLLRTLVCMTCILIGVVGGAVAAHADDVEIERYTLVGGTRISRTIFEYTFAAEASNWGTGEVAAAATLASTSANTVVVDGAVAFGNLARGETAEGSDTFTIRQDRRYLFDELALVWTVQATPLAKTTLELIEEARSLGAIDEETALVYRVFDEMADPRLPAQYIGRDSDIDETTALDDAEVRFESLSPANQAILAPLLEPVDVSGVTILPEVPEDGAGLASGASASPPFASAAYTPPNGWSGAWVVAGEIKIFWDDTVPGDRASARSISAEIRNVVWPKLTALFDAPPLAGTHIEVFVDRGTQRGSRATSRRCTINPQVYLAPGRHHRKDHFAHEMTHALLYYRYPTMLGCSQNPEYRWMHEATAQWAIHYVYPNSVGNVEQKAAPKLLDRPTDQLELFGGKHQYGAYLWFLYLSKGKTSPTDSDVQRVANTWEWTNSLDSLGAINAGLGFAGIDNLQDEWPKFALFNWNRMARLEKPYRKYFEWDGLPHRARESTSAVAPGGFQPPKKMFLDGKIFGGFPMGHTIQHLGAQYWHFDFKGDPNIRRIRLRHPYSDGSQPSAKVQVIVKVKGEDWGPKEDWTSFERKTLCRDKDGSDGNPSQDFEEVVVVISNSEHVNRSHVLQDPAGPFDFRTFLEMSALGCTNWVGSVNFSTTGTLGGIQFTETGTATNVRWEIDQDRFSAQTFKVMGGTVNWAHSASGTREDGDSCNGSSMAGYTLSPGAGQSAFEFSAVFNSNPPLVPKYNAYGFQFGEPGPADYECIDSEPPYDHYLDSPIYGAHDVWLDFGDRYTNAQSPGLYDYQGPGGGLVGFAFVQYPPFDYKASDYLWTINRDPDLATRFIGFDVEPQE